MKILLLGSSIIKHWKNFTMNQQNEEVLNMGKSGLITSNLSSYLDKIPDITPEYIIFYCGTNDILRSFNKNDIVNNLQLCLDNLLKKYPDSIIIVISLIKSPIMYNGKLNEIDYINNSIRKYSSIGKGIYLLTSNETFLVRIQVGLQIKLKI